MKKILTLLFLFSVLLVPSLKSKAYSQELASQVDANFFVYGVQDRTQPPNHIRSDVLNTILTYWENNPNKSLVILATNNSGGGNLFVCDNPALNNGVFTGGQGRYWKSAQWNSGDLWSFNTSSESNSQGATIWNNTYINMGTYTENNIDYSNVIYDPLIPTPDFNVFYVENSTNATQFFPIVFSLNNNTPDYFIEVYMENLTPSSIGIGPKDVYTPYRFYQFPSHAIYSMDSLTLASDVSNGVLNGSLSAAWRSDILSYGISNVDISPNTAAWTTSNPTFILLKESWANFRNIACFYGNNSSVSIRYFQVRNGQIFGGKVKSWTSLYGGNTFSESIPDYYVPDDPAQGYETDTSTDIVPVETANPSVSFPANQTGKKTGLNININLGSNVPNYPDYPTIATYNTDNLLVNAIDTAKQLPNFFASSIAIFNGMFDGLLPDPFWGIIMTGFLFSIVIMIIKVL